MRSLGGAAAIDELTRQRAPGTRSTLKAPPSWRASPLTKRAPRSAGWPRRDRTLAVILDRKLEGVEALA